MRLGNQLHTPPSRSTITSARLASIAASVLLADRVSPCRSSRRFLDHPLNAQLAQLWAEPAAGRNLYWGVGGKALAPDPTATYTVIEIKHTGFSPGYTVTGPDGRQWSAKFPPEAPTEVVASRILWAVGYHQPPIYYVQKWLAEKATGSNPQLPARFREKDPALNGGLEDTGIWSYYQNPFVGTRAAQGPARPAGDARQLGSQGRQQRDLRAQETPRRSANLVRRPRSRAHVRPHRRHERSPRRCRGLREDAIHHRCSSTAVSRSTGAGATTRCSTTSRRLTCAGSAAACSASATRSGRTRSGPAAIRRSTPNDSSAA